MTDTGAIYSVFPKDSIYPFLFLPAPTPLLTTVGGGILHCCGIIKRDIDIGFSRLSHYEFSVADIDYEILGIDFLRKYHLTNDVSSNKLTASIDPERCKRYLVKEHDGLEVGFVLRSDQPTDNSLLQHYRNRSPEVFDATLRSKTILHSVEVAIEVRHNKIVRSKTRRLGPDKFVALKTEIDRLLEAGIIEPSHSEFSSCCFSRQEKWIFPDVWQFHTPQQNLKNTQVHTSKCTRFCQFSSRLQVLHNIRHKRCLLLYSCLTFR